MFPIKTLKIWGSSCPSITLSYEWSILILLFGKPLFNKHFFKVFSTTYLQVPGGTVVSTKIKAFGLQLLPIILIAFLKFERLTSKEFRFPLLFDFFSTSKFKGISYFFY